MTEWKRRSDFRKIILLNLVATTLTVVLGPMAAEVSVNLNVEIADIGLINAIFLLISGIFSFLWAIYADKTKRVRLLIVCSLIWCTGAFLTVFANDFFSLLVFQIIASIGFGGVLPISFSIIVDVTVPEKRSYALGMLQTCITLGTGLGFLLGGILIDFFVWWSPFLIISILGLICICSILSIKEPQRGSLDKMFAQNGSHSMEFTFKIKKSDLKEIIGIKSNKLLILFTFVKSISVGAVNFYFITMMIVDHGFSPSIATLLTLAIFSIMLLSAPVLGKFADRQYQKRKTGKVNTVIVILIVGPLFYLAGFSLIFTASETFIVILFVILMYIGAFFMAGDGPICQSIISDIDPPMIRSTIFSIQFIAQTIGNSLGVFLLGYLYGFYGYTFRMGFILLCLILLSSIFLLIPLRKTVLIDLDYLESKYSRKRVLNSIT